MRIFNLTDVKTPDLKNRGLVGLTIVVGKEVIHPGGYIDVDDTLTTKKRIQHLVEAGALSVDRVPASYALGKKKLEEDESEKETLIPASQPEEAPTLEPPPPAEIPFVPDFEFDEKEPEPVGLELQSNNIVTTDNVDLEPEFDEPEFSFESVFEEEPTPVKKKGRKKKS